MNAAGLQSFRHGVHPDDRKETATLPIERLPFGGRYVLPVGQHLGAPAKPVVRVGDRVARGQLVAEAGGYVSTCLHSPVTGRVTAVAPRRHPNGQLQQAIEIEADAFATQKMPHAAPVQWRALTNEAFITHVQSAGLVGMGGAAFPSHVKYAPPEDKSVRWLVLNGCECEPYLTSDHRMMVERPEAVLRGAHILATRLGVEGIKIGVEANKRDAIGALRDCVREETMVEILPLKVKYPQGAERMLVKAVMGREIPAGKLPLDVGVVVNNVSTMAALADYFDGGQPLIERVVTVAGNAVERPANLMVPIGTPVVDVLSHCGLSAETRQVIMGGPMMGQPLGTLDVPVLKGTSGLLAFTDADVIEREEFSCVRCGRCMEACANFLNPSRLARLARTRRYDLLEAQFVGDCMECGACTYACPSNIPIVQLIRVAKAVARQKQQPK